jgi:hypothetical protein
MKTKTETLNLGGERTPTIEGAGLVTLFASDASAVPSAVALKEGATVFGRDPPPGMIRLPFSSVSRVHARLSLRGVEIAVEDLDSRNGTFVNGEKVRRSIVKHGDVVRIGDVVFKVVAGDVASHAAYPLEGRVPAPPLSALRGGASMDAVRSEILRTARANLSILVLGETEPAKSSLPRRCTRPAEGRGGSRRSTARPSRARSSRVSSSATSAARSRARNVTGQVSSSRRTGARCSSTRSATCRSTRRQSSCG